MDYQLIANIFLAFSAIAAFVVIMRYDMGALQHCGYSSKQLLGYLYKNDEFYNSRHIIPMVGMMACATSLARESWMVVAIIAGVMAVMTVVLFFTANKEAAKHNARTITTWIIAAFIGATCAALLYFNRLSLEAGMMALLCVSFSSLIVAIVNIVINPFFKKKETI